MSKIKPLFIVLFIFLMSLSIRLAFISKGPYHVDCLNLAISSQKTISTGQLHGLFGPGYPMAVILGTLFSLGAKAFSIQDPIFPVNLMSVTFSSLSILCLYFLTRKLWGEKEAIFASLFFSFCPIHLILSVYGKSHIPSVFFMILGFSLLISYSKNYRFSYFLGSAFCLGCMGATRLQDFILILPAACVLLFLGLDQNQSDQKKPPILKAIRSVIVFVIICSVIAILFHLPLVKQDASSQFYSQFGKFWQSGLSHNFRGFFSDSLVASFKIISFNFTPIGLIIALLGMICLAISEKRLFAFLFVWMAVPLLFYGNLFSTVPRMIFLSFLPLFITFGAMSAYLFNRNKISKMITLGLFCVIIFLQFSSVFPTLVFRHKHALLPDFAKWISQKTEDNSLIIGADENPFIKYYGHRKTWDRPLRVISPFEEKDLLAFQKDIDFLLSKDVPLYITSVGLYTYNYGKTFSDFMEQNYTLTPLGEHQSEDWHPGGTELTILTQKLYRILIRDRDYLIK